MAVEIRRAQQRYLSTQPGIETWHEFSAGAHYDPANVAFASLVGVDEHHLAPGTRFERHAHSAVTIVSYVLAGTLRHDGADVRLIGAGEVFRQDAGDWIEHVEGNASITEPLVLLQLTFLGSVDPAVAVTAAPATLPGRCYVHVLSGAPTFGEERLDPGDSVRASEPITLVGTGRCLLVRF